MNVVASKARMRLARRRVLSLVGAIVLVTATAGHAGAAPAAAADSVTVEVSAPACGAQGAVVPVTVQTSAVAYRYVSVYLYLDNQYSNYETVLPGPATSATVTFQVRLPTQLGPHQLLAVVDASDTPRQEVMRTVVVGCSEPPAPPTGAVLAVTVVKPLASQAITIGTAVPVELAYSTPQGATVVRLRVLGRPADCISCALEPLAGDMVAPWQLTWNTGGRSAGPWVIYGEVTSSSGETVISAVRKITLSTPSLAFTAVAPTTAPAGPVTLAATARPTAGAVITKVVYDVDGTPAGTATTGDFSVNWNSNGLQGRHTIRATATDSTGTTGSRSWTLEITSPDTPASGPVVEIDGIEEGGLVVDLAEVVGKATPSAGKGLRSMAVMVDGITVAEASFSTADPPTTQQSLSAVLDAWDAVPGDRPICVSALDSTGQRATSCTNVAFDPPPIAVVITTRTLGDHLVEMTAETNVPARLDMAFGITVDGEMVQLHQEETATRGARWSVPLPSGTHTIEVTAVRSPWQRGTGAVVLAVSWGAALTRAAPTNGDVLVAGQSSTHRFQARRLLSWGQGVGRSAIAYEPVTLWRRTANGWARVATRLTDPQGSVSFSFSARVRTPYRLTLPASGDHRATYAVWADRVRPRVIAKIDTRSRTVTAVVSPGAGQLVKMCNVITHRCSGQLQVNRKGRAVFSIRNLPRGTYRMISRDPAFRYEPGRSAGFAVRR